MDTESPVTPGAALRARVSPTVYTAFLAARYEHARDLPSRVNGNRPLVAVENGKGARLGWITSASNALTVCRRRMSNAVAKRLGAPAVRWDGEDGYTDVIVNGKTVHVKLRVEHDSVEDPSYYGAISRTPKSDHSIRIDRNPASPHRVRRNYTPTYFNPNSDHSPDDGTFRYWSHLYNRHDADRYRRQSILDDMHKLFAYDADAWHYVCIEARCVGSDGKTVSTSIGGVEDLTVGTRRELNANAEYIDETALEMARECAWEAWG